MRVTRRLQPVLLFASIAFATALAATPGTDGKLEPDGAPDRQTDGPGVPRPIAWPAPRLGKGPFHFESAEERNLRITVVARGLDQPWSAAFLPDGNILVTERPGRLRLIKNGVLQREAIAGVPDVHADGLQGLMDVVLHPNFAQNQWVYLTYHKPLGADGAVTLARGVWNGTALIDVHDIFESGAIKTEASRVAFGRDGMLYMTISAPGATPDGMRAQDPSDYAGKTVRLRDDGTVPPTTRSCTSPGTSRPSSRSAIETVTRWW